MSASHVRGRQCRLPGQGLEHLDEYPTSSVPSGRRRHLTLCFLGVLVPSILTAVQVFGSWEYSFPGTSKA